MVARFILVFLALDSFHFMLQLITILNRRHHFPGFVYQQARFCSNHNSIEIAVRPRKGSAAICSRCHQPAPGYDETRREAIRVHSSLGIFCFSALLHAARRLPPLPVCFLSTKFPEATASGP
jgi:hypothetical protein